MPQLVQAVGVWLLSQGVPAAVINFVWDFAVVTLLSSVSSKLFGPKTPGRAGLSSSQITVRSALEYRKVTYGQAMVSGPVVYTNLSGNSAEYLWHVIALTDGISDDLVEIWFDGDSIPKADIDWVAGTGASDGTGTGNVSTAKWVGQNSTKAVQAFYYLGDDAQPVCGVLDTAFAGWGTNDRLRGVTYLVTKFLYNADTESIWRPGIPRNIKAVIKGRKLYDPRLDSTAVLDARTNLALQSEDLSTSWTNVRSTDTQSAGTDPIGGSAANSINEDGSNDSHYVHQAVSMSNTTQYTFSCYMKASNRTWGYLQAYGLGVAAPTLYIDLANGTLGSTTGVVDDFGMHDAGGGWYRCWITFTTGTVSGSNILLAPAASDGVVSYQGTTQESILVWGAQLEQASTAGTYVKTTTTAKTVTYGSGTHRTTDSTTWAWSDNPSLCVADYLLNVMGVAATAIDWASIADAGDDCDVLVAVPTAATETRFTCNGVLSMGSTHKDNLDSLLSSCDGKLSYSGGTWKLRASVWETSSVSFDEDDLAGPVVVRGSSPKAERFNTIRGFFLDPDRKYEAVEFQHVTSATYVTRDNGETIEYDLSLPMTNSETMAQRIAFRNLEQSDNQIFCELTLNARGAKATVGDVVDVTISELSWTAKNFRVIEWSRNQNGTFKLTLREDDSGDYTDPLEGEYNASTAGGITDPGVVVPPPTGLTATGVIDGVKLTWTDPPSRLYDRIEVYANSANTLSTATLIATVPASSYTDPAADIPSTRYYWIRAVLNTGETSSYEPNNSPNTGVSGFPSYVDTPASEGSMAADPTFDKSSAFGEYWDGLGKNATSGTGADVNFLTGGQGPSGTNAVEFIQSDGTDGTGGNQIWSLQRFKATTGAFEIKMVYKVVGSGTDPQIDNVQFTLNGYSAQTGGTFQQQINSGLLSLDADGAGPGAWHELRAIVESYTFDEDAQWWSLTVFIKDAVSVSRKTIYIGSVSVMRASEKFSGAGIQNIGFVPDPVTEAGKFLKDDGSWSATLKEYAIEAEAPTVSANAVTLTYANGPAFEVDLAPATGNVTITLSGGPPSGTYGEIIVKVKQDATARTITWAGGTFEWPGGTQPTLTATASAYDIFHFSSWDTGTTWWGTAVQDMK